MDAAAQLRKCVEHSGWTFILRRLADLARQEDMPNVGATLHLLADTLATNAQPITLTEQAETLLAELEDTDDAR